MGLIELIVTFCALSASNQCEDQHFSFPADMSLHRCVINAQPYIAQWINEHPKWVACGGGATIAAQTGNPKLGRFTGPPQEKTGPMDINAYFWRVVGSV